MKYSKKTLLITLLPAAVTLYFITQVLVPSVNNYNEQRSKYDEAKQLCEETQTSIDELQNNKKLLKEAAELNNQTADFDIRIPSEFQDEFFLADLGKFSAGTATQIISLDSKNENEFTISNPADDKNKISKKKKKSRRKKAEDTPLLPLTIYEKTFEIKVLGHYNQVINFVDTLENYQRKFIINGVSVEISKSDDKNPNPKIELKIEGSTFKQVRNSESEKTE